MLKSNKLLIDHDCPMCAAYGTIFTRLGMIDPHTVSPYQHTDEVLANRIDMKRARSEIALYDETNYRTVYGIDAMIAIVAHRRPWLRRLLTAAPLYFVLRKFYFFVSYNRRVIYPAKAKPGLRDCTPPTHAPYRWLYILLVAMGTGAVLNHYAYPIYTVWELPYDPWRECYLCFGQVVWQGVVIGGVSRKQALTYLGNMSTVSLIGAILLLPLLLVTTFTTLSPWLMLAYFALVVGVMLLEHLRRCRLLSITYGMTVSWVAFRMTALSILLITLFL